MEKLKEIIGLERFNRLNKGIDHLLNVYIAKGYNSVLLSIENEDEIEVLHYLNIDGSPSCEVEVEEKQITVETIGYFPTGNYYCKPIKIFSWVTSNEKFGTMLMISKDNIFELSDVIISKEDKQLAFSTFKLL